MKKLLFTLLICTFFALPAKADTAVNKLSTCLSDSTTGRDRKDMAQWMFVMMSVHPDIQNLSNITEETRDQYNKLFADIVTRLLTVSCAEQVSLVIKEDGSEALVKSFEFLGEVAMKELMSHPDVNASFGEYIKFMDEEKIDAIFSRK